MSEENINVMEDEYATKDLYFAAFLYISNVHLEKLEKSGKGRRGQSPVYFIFKDKERCTDLEEVFWGGVGDDAMVNVKEYFSTIRDLRSRAFSVSRVVGGLSNSVGEIVE